MPRDRGPFGVSSLAMTYALITGATGGIGRAIALELSRRGYRLVLTDLNQAALDDLAAGCGGAEAVACDMTDIEHIAKLVDALDPLPDVLVNSVGRGIMGEFESLSGKDFQQSFEVNFFAPLFISLALYRRWLDAGTKGRILGLSSISGHRAYASSVAYSAAKHAFESAMTILRMDGEPHGIAAGTLCPTNVATGFWDAAAYGGSTSAPDVEHMISADDVAAAAVAWLEGPERPRSVFVPPEIGNNLTVYGLEDPAATVQYLERLAASGHSHPPKPGVGVVTGASAGLGLEISRRLAAGGWKVVGVSRTLAPLEAQLTDNGGPLHRVYSADVGDAPRVAEVLEDIEAQLGAIDLLVNNAGTTKIGWIQGFPDADIRRIFETNFFGYYHPTKLTLPYLERSHGTLLNVVSLTAQRPARVSLPYSCSKVAQAVVSDSLRFDLRDRGVRVIDVYPGNTRTEFFNRAESVDGTPVTMPANAKPVEEVGERIIGVMFGERTTDTID